MLTNIEAERVRNRITQKNMAYKLGISLKTYRNWIEEKTDVPGTALLKMSKIFGTDIDYLMQGCTGVKTDDLAVQKEVV